MARKTAGVPLAVLMLLGCVMAQRVSASCGENWRGAPGISYDKVLNEGKDKEFTSTYDIPKGRWKIGRQTTYNPSSGSEHQGWCGRWQMLNTSNTDAVPVALDQRYMDNSQAKWDNNNNNFAPYCGRYICVRVIAQDFTCVQGETARRTAKDLIDKKGSNGQFIFKGRVQDQCPECEPDHVDVATLPPYSNMVQGIDISAVGIWLIEWDFLPKGREHIDCAAFFNVPQAAQQAGGRRFLPGSSRPRTTNPAPQPSGPESNDAQPAPKPREYVPAASPVAKSPEVKVPVPSNEHAHGAQTKVHKKKTTKKHGKKKKGKKGKKASGYSSVKCQISRGEYQQCGGLGGNPLGVSKDGAWDGVCCKPGLKCKRSSEWWWACVK